MRTLITSTVLAITVALTATTAGAQTEDRRTTISAALDAYRAAQDAADSSTRERHFARSAGLFRAAAEGGAANAELWTNAGNAALQARDVGNAVLAYRRALRIDPRNARAGQNLRHARSVLADWVPRPDAGGALDSFFFWHSALSPAMRSQTGAVAFALAGILLGAGLASRRRFLGWLAIVPAAVWLAMAGSLIADRGGDATADAVVVAREAIARASDSANAQAKFANPLPGGTEVRIVEERAGFVQVELANGRDAWLRASQIETIVPR